MSLFLSDYLPQPPDIFLIILRPARLQHLNSSPVLVGHISVYFETFHPDTVQMAEILLTFPFVQWVSTHIKTTESCRTWWSHRAACRWYYRSRVWTLLIELHCHCLISAPVTETHLYTSDKRSQLVKGRHAIQHQLDVDDHTCRPLIRHWNVSPGIQWSATSYVMQRKFVGPLFLECFTFFTFQEWY